MTTRNPQNDNPVYREVEAWAGIEARPLVTGDILDRIKPKNPGMSLYWVNKGAGDALRYNQMLVAGFVAAKPEELTDVPPTMVKEGKVIYGDVIAMLISRVKYIGALKHNHANAVARGDRLRLKDQIAPEMKRDIVGRSPNEIARKISTFVPSEKDVERLSGPDDTK